MTASRNDEHDTGGGLYRCLGLSIAVGPTADAIVTGAATAEDAWDLWLYWLTPSDLLDAARELIAADERGEDIATALAGWAALRGLR
uniref:Uncharacterized protein n=1 Tax=Mycobacterium sp. (strain KMS) TaxID=189918 RepID=A1UIV0_MYCSK